MTRTNLPELEVDFMDRKMTERRMSGIAAISTGNVREFETIIHQGEVRGHVGLLEKTDFIGRSSYRVAKVVHYINRAGRLQISIYLKDFTDLAEAEELWMNVAVMNTHVFGGEYRLSAGSGLRYIGEVE